MAKYPYEMVKEPEIKDVKSVPAKNKKTTTPKRNAGTAGVPSTSKIIAHTSVVTTAKGQDISKPTVEKEKWITYSNG